MLLQDIKGEFLLRPLSVKVSIIFLFSNQKAIQTRCPMTHEFDKNVNDSNQINKFEFPFPLLQWYTG